jgi:hypothetical protein
LECKLAGAEVGKPVWLRTGDNYLEFEACPMQEGVHLLDGVEAELKGRGGTHGVFMEAVVGTRDVATAASAAQPFGAALVATAGHETLRIGAVLPGGYLHESACQWLGVELAAVNERLTNAVVSVALRGSRDGGDGQLEFAQTREGAGGVRENGGALAAKEQPACAFWSCEGRCLEVTVGREGQLTLPGEVRGAGTLWLAVFCRQRGRQPEAVDIGGSVGGVAPTAAAVAAGAWEAEVEVSITYWCSCWRSKHSRLRLPVLVRSAHCLQPALLIDSAVVVDHQELPSCRGHVHSGGWPNI